MRYTATPFFEIVVLSMVTPSSSMQLKHLLFLLLLAAIWGASFLFTRVSAPEFGPIAFTSVRIGLAAAALLPILFMKNHWGILRENLGLISFVALLNSAFPFMLLAYTTLYLSAGVTSVLNSFVPIFSAVIAHFYLKDHLSQKQTLGLLIGIIGVMILMSDKLAWGNNTILPLCTAFLSGLSYAVGANITKRNLSHVPPRLLAASSMFTAGAMMLPFGAFYWPAQMPSNEAWLSIIAVALLSTAFAYLIFFWLLKEIGPTRTVSVTLIIPIFGVAWGALFLHEPITLSIILGTVVILIGAYLSLALNWFTRRI